METVLAKKLPLQVGVTTGNGTAVQLNGDSRHITAYIVGSAGVSAGAVQLETAPDPDYTGTWAAIGTATTVTATTAKIVQAVGTFGVIRARVSTNIVGGTVSVYLYAN